MLKETVTHKPRKEGSFPTSLKGLHENMKGHMLDRLLLLPVTLMTTLITVTLNLLFKDG
jgi:hypothetical protein